MEFNVSLTYEIQEKAGGIAQALGLAASWADDDDVAVILGDNIFQNNVKADVASFKKGAKIFLKEVIDAQRFGVAEFKQDHVISIEEKNPSPKSNFAVTRLYLYDYQVFSIIRTLKPSGRGELEITDVNNVYHQKDMMNYAILKGFWSDAGTLIVCSGRVFSCSSIVRGSNLMVRNKKKLSFSVIAGKFLAIENRINDIISNLIDLHNN